MGGDALGWESKRMVWHRIGHATDISGSQVHHTDSSPRKGRWAPAYAFLVEWCTLPFLSAQGVHLELCNGGYAQK